MQKSLDTICLFFYQELDINIYLYRLNVALTVILFFSVNRTALRYVKL